MAIKVKEEEEEEEQTTKQHSMTLCFNANVQVCFHQILWKHQYKTLNVWAELAQRTNLN